MWERGARHNPMTARYMMYSDHRAILPQDNTQSGWLGFRRSHNDYELIYFKFLVNGGYRYLISNNMKAEDRERLKSFLGYSSVLSNNIGYLSLVPALIVSSSVFKYFSFSRSYLKGISFVFLYFMTKNLAQGYFDNLSNTVLSYYYHKYEALTTDSLNKIEDPRRKFFRLDTNTYYRQTAQQIYDEKSPSQLHDSAIYYGPHPYDDYENVPTLIELNKKFTEGESGLDHNELVLNEPIDIKRIVRGIPTAEEYRSI